MTEKQIFIPNLKWYQDKDNIYLDIEANNAIDFSLKITENNNLFFTFQSENNYYEMNFELYNKADHIKHMDHKSYVKITLEKKVKEYWKYLSLDKNIYKNHIKLNWNKWMDEETDDEKDFDYNNMMKNMGGMMNNENSPFDFSKMMQSMNGDELDNMDEEDDNLEECNSESEEYCENCVINE